MATIAKYDDLIKRRDELILAGVDPDELLVPIKPIDPGGGTFTRGEANAFRIAAAASALGGLALLGGTAILAHGSWAGAPIMAAGLGVAGGASWVALAHLPGRARRRARRQE